MCRTPAGQADGTRLIHPEAALRLPDGAAPAAANVYTHRGSSRSAGFLWLEGTFPSVLEPSG